MRSSASALLAGPRRYILAPLLPLVVAAALLPAPTRAAPTPPGGFQDLVVLDGLSLPTAVEFSPDGRVFVAEKSGIIKVFDGLVDPSPDVFADLNINVHNYWDRGLLGLALDPDFPTEPYVYVGYTHDAAIGGTAPRWGDGSALSDPCPMPPDDGCVVSARVSRLQAEGNAMVGAEQVLLEDWCQQYPSHSIGDLAFGPDGALYVSGGEGASFDVADYGQDGAPVNPCGDPPAGVGGAQTPPTAEGGALRSQDLRTSADPAGLSGSVLRIDPATGAALPDNPRFASSDANERRIIAHGLRNPFRMVVRPGTDDIYVAEVGWQKWEEIDLLASPTDAAVENFGWPCYEGGSSQASYDALNLTICETLYSSSDHVGPFFTYRQQNPVYTGDPCSTATSSISGIAFYAGGSYPDAYDGALFFADYSRRCIWAMLPSPSGAPDPAQVQAFVKDAPGPVDLEIGPGGDLFYVDIETGAIHRIQHFDGNVPPTAVARAAPAYGSLPLTVTFDGTESSDPDPGDSLSYAWDLDGDGAFDDANVAQPSRTYRKSRNYTVTLRVTDRHGASHTDSVVISAGNTPPDAVIDQPDESLSWAAGDVIDFSGGAADAEEPLGDADLMWSLVLRHCSSGGCHSHHIQDFEQVSSGTFTAVDHEYPAHLKLSLTATDSRGLTDTETVRLDPRTVWLRFVTSPEGLDLAVGSKAGPAPFAYRSIVRSNLLVSAPEQQSLDGLNYDFIAWSDGGAATHGVTAPEEPATYSALYGPFADGFESGDMSRWSGSSGFEVQSAESFRGSFAARTAPGTNPSYATKALSGTHPELHYRLRFKILDKGDGQIPLLRFRDDGGQSILRAFVSSEGFLAYRNDVTGRRAVSGRHVSSGSWHQLQVRAAVDDGKTTVWLDRDRIGALSGPADLGAVRIGGILLGGFVSSRDYDIVVDDVAVAATRVR